MARVALSKIRFVKIKRLPEWKRKKKAIIPTFSDMSLRSDVVESLKAMNVVEPTLIQLRTIPKVLQGENVFCGAETGSGKTLAYLAPLVSQLKNKEHHGVVARLRCPRSLILAPSRELAFQILSVAKHIAHFSKIRAMGFIGGVKRKRICESLKQPIDVAVATPHSLLLSKQKFGLSLTDVSHFVLDEVDTLLDDSFYKNTVAIIKLLNLLDPKTNNLTNSIGGCQVIMACATWSEGLEKNVRKHIPSVQMITSKELQQMRFQVEQVFVKVRTHLKADKLLDILRGHEDTTCLVFCNSIPSCDWTYHHLIEHGINCLKLHGQVPPQIRRKTLKDFRDGSRHVLVCTDIASRGLDLPEVDLVVNFDFPNSLTDYIHRSGRTGRISSKRKGSVISLMSHRKDVRMALDIKY